MTLDKVFFDELSKLEDYKNDPDWNDFFDAIAELEKLGEKINDEMHKKRSDTSKLDKKARSLTKKLVDKKDEIAKRTKTQVEYDAVYECIDHLDGHFNFKK
jgi:hypothetical protein